MEMTAKLLSAMAVAGILVLPALAQHVMPPVTEIQNAVSAGFTPTEWHQMTLRGMTSSMLEGKPVIGMGGDKVGYILAVNDLGHMVELQMPGDRAISMPESGLRMQGGNVYATHMGWRGRTASMN